MSITRVYPPATILSIAPDGKLRFLWDDSLAPLLELGEASIQRVSHVEPQGTMWIADLTLVDGPRLGPFTLRKEALASEADWLLQHGLGTLPNPFDMPQHDTT